MSELLTPRVISILRSMYLNVEKWYYTRELAKLAGVSSWSVSRQFSRLVKDGMVQERLEGKEKFYRLNLSNVKTRKICEFFEVERRENFLKKNRRLAWVLEDFVRRAADFTPEIQSIILFGSVARGEATTRSDVDILVLVPNYDGDGFKKLMNSVDQLASEASGRHPAKLAPVVMMMKDFEQGLREKKRFMADILNDGIVFFGEERYYHLLSKVV